MMRILHLAAMALLGAALGGCSDHAAALESAKGGAGLGGAAPAGSGGVTPLPGLPTTPAAGVTPLPGTTVTPGGVPAASGCQPAQVANIAPVWRPPSQPRAACTQVEGQAVVARVFGQPDNTPVSAACLNCAISPKSTSSFYGPLIIDEATQGLEINVEGCAALLSNDISANGCGPRLQARYLCQEQACAQCGSAQEIQSCMAAADQGVCAQYVANAAACQNYAAQCLAGGSEVKVAFDLIGMFCGG